MSDARFVCSFVCCCTVGSSTGVSLFTIVCHRLPPFNFMYVCQNKCVYIFISLDLSSFTKTHIRLIRLMYVSSFTYLISLNSMRHSHSTPLPGKKNQELKKRGKSGPGSKLQEVTKINGSSLEFFRANKTMDRLLCENFGDPLPVIGVDEIH